MERETGVGGACPGQYSTFILSHANGVVHHGGASTSGCSLGGNTLRVRFEGQTDGQEPLSGSAEPAPGGGVRGAAGRSAS